MSRSARAFTAESFELEGRLLLAAESVPPALLPPVQFVTASPLGLAPVEVVTQQTGEATVMLSRTDTAGSLQVEVTTDPSSPYVGVNVGAVDQTVTFADGQSQATLTVPILAGAPNPGEVHVALNITPIDPATLSPPPISLVLQILASDPTAPPKVVSVEDISYENDIVLKFNKPMNPVGASNVKNYEVSLLADAPDGGLAGIFASHAVLYSVPLKSAEYDPATQSVTLIPKHRIDGFDPTASLIHGHRARTSVRPGQQSNASHGLTDLQGNPINVGTTPGKVAIRVVSTSEPD